MPSSRPPPHVSRRGLLLGGAGLMALTGCSDVQVPGGTPSPGPVPPDVRAAGEAVAAITATAGLVRRTTARFPGLENRLSALSSMHAAHLRALRDAATAAPSTAATPLVLPARRPAARAAVVTAEVALAGTLRRLAVAAESGEFARLLAAMVAATDQRLRAVRG